MTANDLKTTIAAISTQTHTQVTPDLKKWRNRLNLSPEGMSQYMGVPVHTWIKWEKGERKPPASALALFQVLQMAETLAPALHEALMPKKP
jgi:DNA-binding transcriptional regulator YiaG